MFFRRSEKMKYVIRLAMVAAVCSLGLASADDAQACKFLKKLLNRGGGCCSTSCCEPAPVCCEPAPSCDCGCPAVSDCGCGGEAVVSEGEVIIEEHVVEPTEASPADSMPAVPEPPAADDAAEGAVEEAAEAAADASA
jgi:hypothetical protein